MRAVKTNELEAGMWAAHAMDTPNCGGIQITKQGRIDRVEYCDIWGTHSETHTTVYMGENMYTVHNSHTWLVRTIP